MIFIETRNAELRVPSRDNLKIWTTWVNSEFVRRTVPSTRIPHTIDLQWEFIQESLASKKRILLEIWSKSTTSFLGVVSLSEINNQNRSAQIATISPTNKRNRNMFLIYEARQEIVKYAFQDLNLNKVWGEMLYPENKGFLANNMCLGFKIEGVNIDSFWFNNEAKMSIRYYITRKQFNSMENQNENIENLLCKENRIKNRNKIEYFIKNLDL
jgi:RimJ/RimL family protein N-acetyltransferase